ncbi:cobyrinate a,c-diamide synthase [Solirubrobacter sp. CPCC 204708]|uniref:cobyrinate a,c-diamide synthase n=1 Tax=Solirubrobacter deserti TaxID=2282478 RepID=UPI001EEEA294|nr:cobyrinate a,c-diamide synthase [Solirubrobacter deserti]MBE2316031.1 cobyrinate a,c-diamide synthase [Solirubrobacter deserti]
MVIPRVVIAGTSSGAGKTTVATGIMAALSNVAAFKVGPDFIDPSYHALATGRPGRNLDAFLSSPELIAPLVRHGAAGADIAVIEGVMGLYDGASGRGELASTAHVAKLLQAPVVLVVNCEAMARSVAAIVHGYRTFDPDVNVAGVILNKVGSSFHADILHEALPDIPVLGALHRNAALEVPERHLGLVPVAERAPRARAVIEHLGAAIKEFCDLEAIVALARTAPERPGEAWAPRAETARVRVAIARGPAFSFHYQENLELLRGAGAELAEFDPLTDEALPDADALILAGGFPEVFGEELSANEPLRREIAAFDGPILAECGGLLYLAETLDERPMCGVLPVEAHMTQRLTLGYREATSLSDHPVWPKGTTTRGHEFHYSTVSAAGNAWEHQRGREGHVAGNVHASYLHTHWAATPEVADRLVTACG